MKKWMSVFLLAFALHVQAQTPAVNDPKAGEILDAMSKKYQAIPAFKASFTYTTENKASGAKESFPGEIAVKGNKFRLIMGGQEVINNGTTVWTYTKESNEVNISDYQPEEDEITPTKIFNVYKKGFKYTFTEETQEKGVAYEVVDLMPEKKNSRVFKVRFTVHKKDKSIKTVRVFEKNGNKAVYTINKFTVDNSLDDKLFAFDEAQHKGIEVIDLRDK